MMKAKQKTEPVSKQTGAQTQGRARRDQRKPNEDKEGDRTIYTLSADWERDTGDANQDNCKEGSKTDTRYKRKATFKVKQEIT